MDTLDFSPLFRTAIGFDRLTRLAESARRAPEAPAYPPYNIEKTGEDTYVLTMAVAGFAEADLEITARENTLAVAGKAPAPAEGRTVLHRGIAGRAFERRFVLADHIVVDGAELAHGLLHVSLRREVPEAARPRRIAVSAGPARAAIANDGAEPARDAA